MAEPTPANVKNRGVANIRRRRRDEGRETGRNGEESREREKEEGYGEQGGRGENEAVETQEVREAMAEAIREIEREEEETEGRGNEEQWRTQTEATRPGPPAVSFAEEEEGRQARAAKTTERQRSGQRGQEDKGEQQVQSAGRESTERPHGVNAGTNANDGETSSMGEATQRDSRTPLQKLRNALRRRFGQETIRAEAEITGRMEHTVGTGTETPKQRRLRLGKGPMEPHKLRGEKICKRRKSRESKEERRLRRQRPNILDERPTFRAGREA